MSTRTANGQSRGADPYSRGPEWRKFEQALKVERGWRCERCGRRFKPFHAPDLWACHLNPFEWHASPATRFDKSVIKLLCRNCDPDRNPRLRPAYWSDPSWRASTPSASRGRAVHHRGGRKGTAVGSLLLSLPVWWGAVEANGHLRYYSALRSVTIAPPGTSGRSLLVCLGELLALWVASFLASRHALSHHWFRRAVAGLWHAPGRLLGKAKGAPEGSP